MEPREEDKLTEYDEAALEAEMKYEQEQERLRSMHSRKYRGGYHS